MSGTTDKRNSAIENDEAPGNVRTPLREYEQWKFELAALLRTASAAAPEGLRNNFQDLLGQLAGDRFHIAVMGQFNRGKTTLMNALMGMDRLPTGIVPVTSVITCVSYGSSERVILRYENSRLFREVPLSQLEQHVTEQHNPGNRQKIAIAEVQLPAELLRRGFLLVDTPGLSSSILENTRTTEDFLPQADAIILVTSFESPLSAEELSFFRKACGYVPTVFLVVNKMDLVNHEEREQVLAYARRQLTREILDRSIDIVPLSARGALEAMRTGDPQRRASSGLPELESALLRFLAERKSRDFLVLMCRRLSGLLEVLDSPERRDLRAQLCVLQEHLGVLDTTFARLGSDPAAAGQPALHRAPVARPCGICRSTAQAVFDFLTQWQYLLSANKRYQQDHSQNRGFCAFHTWQYYALASPRGVSTAYPALLERWHVDLRYLSAQVSSGKNWRQGLHEGVSGAERCAACSVAREAESQAVTEFISALPRQSSGAREGICLVHLFAGLDLMDDSKAVSELLSEASGVVRRLAEDLQRFALKHDGLRRDLITAEEHSAPMRALELLVGHRSVQPGAAR